MDIEFIKRPGDVITTKDEFIPKMLAYAERKWREELPEGEEDEMQMFGEACAIMREHADYFSKRRFPG